jgi:hypothetical protein
MKTMMKVLGIGWAMIGVFCVLFDLATHALVTQSDVQLQVVTVLCHVLLFIFPGLGLYGVASIGEGRKTRDGEV